LRAIRGGDGTTSGLRNLTQQDSRLSQTASHIKRNGAALYYEATGPTSGSGLPVLLTHGFAATSRIWRAQSEAFSARNEFIRWDMRGHGRSGSPPDEAAYSVDETVEDMATLLDQLGHERAIIGGHSLGGYMALAFYLKYPDRVKALFVVATGPGYKSNTPREEWNDMARGLGRRLEKNGLEELRKLDRDMDPADHDSVAGLGRAARGMLVQRDSRIIDSLPDIAVPTLVVVGEKDRGYLAASDYMAGKIPKAELVTIPNAGHAVNLHQTASFNAAATKYFEQIE
jgi:pimeloyl-ACP methyl ester carboxylesterase